MVASKTADSISYIDEGENDCMNLSIEREQSGETLTRKRHMKRKNPTKKIKTEEKHI